MCFLNSVLNANIFWWVNKACLTTNLLECIANLDLLLLSGFLGHILVFAMVYKSDQSWVDNFVNFVTKK